MINKKVVLMFFLIIFCTIILFVFLSKKSAELKIEKLNYVPNDRVLGYYPPSISGPTYRVTEHKGNLILNLYLGKTPPIYKVENYYIKEENNKLKIFVIKDTQYWDYPWEHEKFIVNFKITSSRFNKQNIQVFVKGKEEKEFHKVPQEKNIN